MKKGKKQTFTLLELTLCIAILVIVAGFIGNKAIGFIGHYRFENDVKRFKIDLEQIQLLALSYQADISLSLYQKNDTLVYRAHTNEPALKLAHLEKENTLKSIGYCRFNEKPLEKSFYFVVFSNGRIEPSGALEMKQYEGHQDPRIVDFSQPLQIKISDKYPKTQTDMLPTVQEIMK